MILIVDDDYPVALVVQRACAAWGMESVVAHNGADALDVLRSHGGHVSAIVLDLLMPVMDGNEFLAHYRDATDQPPVILLSAYLHTLKDEVRSLARHQMKKPPNLEKLLTILQECETNHGKATA